ncbi:MAG: hotdog domain-containing protein [Succiniclasticum sp.]|jgi:predicted thioesterase|nr:hotdog domain-containing protein [Succiniclasticum sp.]MEE3479979.1 hotdog domain-containing protein [Succiniclasticum sp.]
METAKPVSKTLTQTVTEDMLAVRVGSGTLRVLGTPVLARLYEQAAQLLAGTYCEAGTTTVGSFISLSHDAPTPLGMAFTVTATLTKHEGRIFEFDLEAKDETGVISRGRHTRVAVYSEKFQAKADAKAK